MFPGDSICDHDRSSADPASAGRLRYQPDSVWDRDGAEPDEVKQLVAEGYKSIGNQKDLHFEVETLEGTMRGEIDDYLVRGVQGELYVIKKDIFEQTYDVIG